MSAATVSLDPSRARLKSHLSALLARVDALSPAEMGALAPSVASLAASIAGRSRDIVGETLDALLVDCGSDEELLSRICGRRAGERFGDRRGADEGPLEPLGALGAWRRAVRQGRWGQRADRPGSWQLDPMLMAACCEVTARECEHAGLTGVARGWIAQAAGYLAQGKAGRPA